MNYTQEQLAIIRHMGQISTQMRETVAAHQQAQADAGYSMIEAVSALTAAINRSNELTPIFVAYVDVFHEFLDSLS